jgi:hypothetical protein
MNKGIQDQARRAKTLAWQRARDQRAAGRIARPATWGGKPTAKESRRAWNQRGEH